MDVQVNYFHLLYLFFVHLKFIRLKMSSPSNNPSESVTNSEDTDCTIEINSSSTDRSTCHIAAGINNIQCSTTVQGQNGLWSKPYPPIDRSGYVDDHDRPFFLYHKQDATEISENKNFSLPASYEPWVKGKKGSNKLQLNVRKLAISGFSNVSRLNFVEYGLFKGEKKNGPPLMWSQFKKSSLDNETAAQLITSVEDNVGDIMVDFAFKAPRNAIKGYTGIRRNLECFQRDFNQKRKRLTKDHKEHCWPDSFPDCTPKLKSNMNYWLVNHFARTDYSQFGRPKALFLVGNTGTGKTSFALSLPGKPNHCRGYRSRDNWDDEADYIVLDDVPWNKIAKRGFLDKEDLITGQTELVAKEKYSKNKTIQTKKPAIVLLNPAAAKSFLELLEKKNDNNADFWRERSFVYVMGADEYFFKPKVIEGPLDTVTYTVDGVRLFDAYRRAWREDKEGTAAAVTVISEEEEEEENQESLSTASPAALSKATQTSNCIEEECNNQADMGSVPSEQFEYYS
ncbi:unnamed protein product [Rotaria magnacalcarata]|uniref:Replication-associated protein n=3 Tax=Rotaria magnacalcarata TaxID=392030 RepID=A0A8S2S5C2_9BILA|nr:unnamed protein product [Rotaria magnacalcarata]